MCNRCWCLIGQFSCLPYLLGQSALHRTNEFSCADPLVVELSLSPWGPVTEGDGQALRLLCEIVDGNPTTPYYVNWFKDDQYFMSTADLADCPEGSVPQEKVLFV